MKTIRTAFAVAAALVAAGITPALATAAPPVKQWTFTAPGNHTWTVPNGFKLASLDVYGAQGGPCSGVPLRCDGGLGGRATAVLAVRPGQMLQIVVGGNPGFSSVDGGFNGGGGAVPLSGNYGGGGGGASDVRGGPCVPSLSCSLNQRLVVAGGGGGDGSDIGCAGGAGGGEPGGTGSCVGGAGGTNTAGGSPGCESEGSLFTPGSFGAGGNGDGGGGGGWYGGGGGGGCLASGGGGGGSGFVTPFAHFSSFQSGVQARDGRVMISKG